MSFFRMSTATANLTLVSNHTRVTGQNRPITNEPVNRDLWNQMSEEQGGDRLSFCLTSWLIDLYSCFMFNHCRVSERVNVCVREREWICVCVRDMCVCVCVLGMAPGYAVLRKKNKQKKRSNEPAPLFGNFLSLPFVPATTLIHSDILLFITKWLLTKLLYALQRAHTNLFITPSTRVEGSIHLQFK